MNGPTSMIVFLIVVKGAVLALRRGKRQAQKNGHFHGAAVPAGGVSKRMAPRDEVEAEGRRQERL